MKLSRRDALKGMFATATGLLVGVVKAEAKEPLCAWDGKPCSRDDCPFGIEYDLTDCAYFNRDIADVDLSDPDAPWAAVAELDTDFTEATEPELEQITLEVETWDAENGWVAYSWAEIPLSLRGSVTFNDGTIEELGIDVGMPFEVGTNELKLFDGKVTRIQGDTIYLG